MRYLLLSLLVAVPSTLFGGTASISWNPNPSSEQVTRYAVYAAKSKGRSYGAPVKIAETTGSNVFVSLQKGTWKIYVAGINIWGQGPSSTPVTISIR